MEVLPVRSSKHLKEALSVRVGNDEKGNPVLIPKKRLVLIGIRRKGDTKFRLKGA